jgi:hypothetical protein
VIQPRTVWVLDLITDVDEAYGDSMVETRWSFSDKVPALHTGSLTGLVSSCMIHDR